MSEQSKMLEVKNCVDCGNFYGNSCIVTGKYIPINESNTIPTDCPLPDYNWKEKLLEFIDKNSFNGSDAIYWNAISKDKLKQKIKEL